MSISLKDGGVWRSAQGLFVKVGADWKLVDEAYEKVGGVWTTFHKNVIEAAVTSGVGLVASTVFSTADWASSTPKKIIIPAGVTIGSNSPGSPAVNVNTGFGGTLTIENAGTILGAGGVANSGVGGTALLASQAIELINSGYIYSGGGGGGHGGTGGGGYYHSTEDSGYIYNGSYYTRGSHNQYKMFVWAGAYLGQYAGNPAVMNHGGYTYYQGATVNGDDHQIRRTRTLTHYTSGGGGGWGGRGQGYNHALAGGNPPAAGGTNAGTGGWGGTGGGWGANGAGGANGASGNYAVGAGGAGGGLAGYALQGLGNITLDNTGSILGRQA